MFLGLKNATKFLTTHDSEGNFKPFSPKHVGKAWTHGEELSTVTYRTIAYAGYIVCTTSLNYILATNFSLFSYGWKKGVLSSKMHSI